MSNKLIYARALASLMADAKTLATTVILENNGYTFKATGSVLTFDGYLKVYSEYEDSEDVILPDFKNYKSKVIVCSDIKKIQHFTEPKPISLPLTFENNMTLLLLSEILTFCPKV